MASVSGVSREVGFDKVDIRLPGNRECKLPWHKAVLLHNHLDDPVDLDQ